MTSGPAIQTQVLDTWAVMQYHKWPLCARMVVPRRANQWWPLVVIQGILMVRQYISELLHLHVLPLLRAYTCVYGVPASCWSPPVVFPQLNMISLELNSDPVQISRTRLQQLAQKRIQGDAPICSISPHVSRLLHTIYTITIEVRLNECAWVHGKYQGQMWLWPYKRFIIYPMYQMER